MTSNSANSSTLTPYASTESSLVVSRLSANAIARVATWEAVRRKRESFIMIFVSTEREEVEAVDRKRLFDATLPLSSFASTPHQRGT